MLGDDHRHAQVRRRHQLHRLREVPRRRAWRPPGRQPADARADHDPGRQGAALHRRLRAQAGRQGRLAPRQRPIDRARPDGQAVPRPVTRPRRTSATASRTRSRARESQVVLGLDPDPAQLLPEALDAVAAGDSHGRERAAARGARPLPRADRGGGARLRRRQAAAGLLRAARRAGLGGAGRRGRARRGPPACS